MRQNPTGGRGKDREQGAGGQRGERIRAGRPEGAAGGGEEGRDGGARGAVGGERAREGADGTLHRVWVRCVQRATFLHHHTSLPAGPSKNFEKVHFLIEKKIHFSREKM